MSVFSSEEILEINSIVSNALIKEMQNIIPDSLNSQYMDKKQACKYLKISMSTLDIRLKESVLKGYCVGGKRLLLKKIDLDSLVQEKIKK